APAEEAVQAIAAFFGAAAEPPQKEAPAEQSFEAEPLAAADEPAPAPRPGFLRPFSVPDEDDGEDAVPDFSLPLRRSAGNHDEANDVGEPDEDAGEESEVGYSSLLGMRNPFVAPKN